MSTSITSVLEMQDELLSNGYTFSNYFQAYAGLSKEFCSIRLKITFDLRCLSSTL